MRKQHLPVRLRLPHCRHANIASFGGSKAKHIHTIAAPAGKKINVTLPSFFTGVSMSYLHDIWPLRKEECMSSQHTTDLPFTRRENNDLLHEAASAGNEFENLDESGQPVEKDDSPTCIFEHRVHVVSKYVTTPATSVASLSCPRSKSIGRDQCQEDGTCHPGFRSFVPHTDFYR